MSLMSGDDGIDPLPVDGILSSAQSARALSPGLKGLAQGLELRFKGRECDWSIGSFFSDTIVSWVKT